jgi:mono/diheme cytochrome c family protein
MHRVLRLILAVMFLAACHLLAQNVAVTGIEGDSWLHHLARNFDETSMGKTGRLGPSETSLGDDTTNMKSRPLPILAAQAVTVRGADLYRMNCRGCHGETGVGAPPEINSVISPVRSTSVALVMQRMKTLGMDVSPATAGAMARQSRAALLQRLHQGGENMPSFPHLSEAESRALMAYLKQLAGVPGAEREQVTLHILRVRVGEHIAKSTCHICHAATGSNPNSQQIMDGAIPPLSALTTRKDLPGFVRKVTEGTPVLMGAAPLLCRGRMPVFGYLSEDEAEDVYLYLKLYPPRASATMSTSTVPVGPGQWSGNSLGNVAHSPQDASPGDARQVSLVRYAVFPSVLFLFLSGVVMKYLPLIAKLHDDGGTRCRPCEAPVGSNAMGASKSMDGEELQVLSSGVGVGRAP